MAITVSEFEAPDRFRSKHWIHTKTGDGKELVTLTGIALVNFKGTGSDWQRDTLQLQFKLPDIIPVNKALKIEQWAPFITINAIFNENYAVNAGWAVDEFWGPGAIQTKGWINLWANVAIRDIDGWLYRVAYSVTILGSLVDWQQPPIE